MLSPRLGCCITVAAATAATAAALAATAAVEHFRPGDLPPSFPAASQLKHATEGAKAMYGLVPNALGGIPAHPAKPQNLHSTGGSGAWLAR